jgi:hypothetical protein
VKNKRSSDGFGWHLRLGLLLRPAVKSVAKRVRKTAAKKTPVPVKKAAKAIKGGEKSQENGK